MADIDDRRAIIARLYGAAGKELKDSVWDGYAEALKLMTTPRLFRAAEHVLDGIKDLTDPTDYRPPTPGALWKVSRGLRSLPAPPTESESTPDLNNWEVAANLHLLNYVTLGFVQKAVHGQRPTRDANRYAPDTRYDAGKRFVIPGPQTHAITAILVKWKNLWAREMREDRELYDGKRDGKALWADYMQRAETEIDRLERAAA